MNMYVVSRWAPSRQEYVPVAVYEDRNKAIEFMKPIESPDYQIDEVILVK